VRIPFTVEEFLAVFERYNLAVWPAQLAAYGLGVAAVALAGRGGRRASVGVAIALAALWAFTGLGYHAAFFRSVNPAAGPAGALFVLEGLLLVAAAARGRLSFRWAARPLPLLGAALVAYAMVVYPLLGALAGHGWPRVPSFGITPCPLVIFTFGLLLAGEDRVPGWLLPSPALWSLLGRVRRAAARHRGGPRAHVCGGGRDGAARGAESAECEGGGGGVSGGFGSGTAQRGERGREASGERNARRAVRGRAARPSGATELRDWCERDDRCTHFPGVNRHRAA
jgi:hypothetical protein